MKIYHGSACEVAKPALSKGKVHNDYGRGFYCTEDAELAREWACKGNGPPGFANVYEFKTEGLRVLDLGGEEYTVLNWIAVLLANRTFDLDTEVAVDVRAYFLANFMPPVAEADVVMGYRADDSYFSYADSFVNNTLPVRRLAEALRLGRLGTQVALRSERAFGRIEFLGAETVPWAEYHARQVARDAAAREAWSRRIRRRHRAADEVYAIDIIRRRLKHGDAGLRKLLPG